jgi:hypothetical protein
VQVEILTLTDIPRLTTSGENRCPSYIQDLETLTSAPDPNIIRSLGLEYTRSRFTPEIQSIIIGRKLPTPSPALTSGAKLVAYHISKTQRP